MVLPRFDFASSVDLAPVLTGLGAGSLFDPATADLTGIAPEGELYLQSSQHRSTVAIDEQGTTAAATTGIVGGSTLAVPNAFLTRPFLFFIYDHDTGTVLFAGRYVRPAGDAHAPAVAPVVKTDAEIICEGLASCSARTMTTAECVTALAADDAAVVEQCADCVQLGIDECGGFGTIPAGCVPDLGDLCQPATCAAYCPAHAF